MTPVRLAGATAIFVGADSLRSSSCAYVGSGFSRTVVPEGGHAQMKIVINRRLVDSIGAQCPHHVDAGRAERGGILVSDCPNLLWPDLELHK